MFIKFIKEFFYFQKSDRIVLVTALCVAAIAFGLIFVVGEKNSATGAADADSAMVARDSDAGHPGYYAVPGRKAERFAFDPNTADSTQLLRLGLSPWQVRNIYKYRAEGGVYRQKSDFARVYGLTVEQYESLEPYIHISRKYKPAADYYGQSFHRPVKAGARDPYHPAATGDSVRRYVAARDTSAYTQKLKMGQTVDVNTADTTLLMKVPGIGPARARNIIRHRERLGGFFSVDQLVETVEDIPYESIPFLTFSADNIRKINLNKASKRELIQHPYIGKRRAPVIDSYRRQKGYLKSLEDLSLSSEFTHDDIVRLLPYVEF